MLPAMRTQRQLCCQTAALVRARRPHCSLARPCPATPPTKPVPRQSASPPPSCAVVLGLPCSPPSGSRGPGGWGAVEKPRALLEIHLARPQQELFWDTGNAQCSWVLAPVKIQRQKLLSRGPRTQTPVPRGARCRAGGPAGLARRRRWVGRKGRLQQVTPAA